MFSEILAIAAILIAAIGVTVQWYNNRQNRIDKQKEVDHQRAEYSIGQYVAGGAVNL